MIGDFMQASTSTRDVINCFTCHPAMLDANYVVGVGNGSTKRCKYSIPLPKTHKWEAGPNRLVGVRFFVTRLISYGTVITRSKSGPALTGRPMGSNNKSASSTIIGTFITCFLRLCLVSTDGLLLPAGDTLAGY